jgi:hypothetical protein
MYKTTYYYQNAVTKLIESYEDMTREEVLESLKEIANYDKTKYSSQTS